MPDPITVILASRGPTFTIQAGIQGLPGPSGSGGGGGASTIDEVAGLRTALNGLQTAVNGLQTALNGKADATHTQSISSITGLQTSLDTLNSAISSVSSALAGKADATHTQSISSITGLQTSLDGLSSSISSVSSALAGKADATHTQSISSITGLQTSLDGLSSSISSLNAALASKADATHTQSISSITGLQASLDGLSSSISSLNAALASKADATHTQAISSITGLQASLDGKQPASTTLDDIVSKFTAAAIGTAIYKKDASSLDFKTIAASADPTTRGKVEISSHFLSGQGEWQSRGNGYYNSNSSLPGRPGIMKLITDTGQYGLRTDNTCFTFGSKAAVFKAALYLPTLSNSSDAFTINLGFLTDVYGSENAVCFRYSHDTAGGNWQLVGSRAWSETSVNTGVAVTAATWHTLEIQVAADGSQAVGYINGTQAAIVSTNIPQISSSQFTGAGFYISKSAGSSSRELWLDYAYATQDV